MSKSPFQNFVVRFRNGESVFSAGDIGATMFIVQSGSVRLHHDADGEQRELGVMEKGDFFGEMSILEGLPRTHSATAVDDTELIEINSTTFDKMIKSNIEIAIRMLRKLSIRLREAERRLNSRGLAGSSSGARIPTTIGETADSAGASITGIRLEAEEGATAFPLTGPETLIGRYDPVTELKPDVDLTDLDLKRSVSRRHARILETSDGFALVEEVGALNGTFVNGTRLAAGEPHPIREGDTLGFGMVRVVFRG
ncbi:MAG TPA: cyclic nucleotide-binding domain-containing protein [Candidatus Polarisedimenticolaceae bacterium]|nr:cyclic nucleotide-binding domain-containing protein [Candidatus Polarisedimenticolaceae bacterium]